MTLPPPAHGGELKQLLLPAPPAELHRLPFLRLTPRQQCDVEMLLTGAFSPLGGFLGRDDYLAVLQTQRLADGTLWPVPVMLDVDRGTLDAVADADQLLLLDAELNPVAVLEMGEVWQPDRGREAKILHGTDEVRHDGARLVLCHTASHYLSGRLRGIRLPSCRFQAGFRLTPPAHRAVLGHGASRRCLAWFPFRPLQRAELDDLKERLAACNAGHLLLLHSPHLTPVAAPAARVTARCLEAVLPRLAAIARVSYCSVPLWPRWAGMREIVWRAIISQNYGASHYLADGGVAFPVLPDGTRPPATRSAAELLEHARRELAIEWVDLDGTATIAAGAGNDTDPENEFPEVAGILRRQGRRRAGRGCALFLTGLSGAGKSSLAHALADQLETAFGRTATVLDGDYSRQLLTSDLGASADEQLANVLRHAFVAAEVARHGGIAIVALVAPDAAARAEARRMVEARGGFIELYLAASAEACEQRDQKGIYARIRTGSLGAGIGIAAQYEVPANAEIVLDTTRNDVASLAAQVVDYLLARGYLAR